VAKSNLETTHINFINHIKFFNLYSSPNIIRMIKSRRMRCAGHVAGIGEKRNALTILMLKPEGKRPLGRPRRWWVDNVNIDLREIRWDGMDLIDLAQHRDHGDEPSGCLKCWGVPEWLHNWQLLRKDSAL
jgi:hypothetical protein